MSLIDQVVQRRRLSAEGGLSGNLIERVTLRDGRELIHKRVNPDDDWISRATGDRGRLVSMWEPGLVARVPPVVDHGIIAVEADERGWSVFMRDMSAFLLPLVEDPTPLADLLRTCEQTLIHGDLRLDNLGFTDRGIVLLDWGERTGSASPAVELMWFLGFDALRLDCTREEVISDFLALYGDRVDERAMDLAFVGGFVHHGCHLGLGMIGRSPTLSHLTGDAAAKRAAASTELSWWLQTVQRALERSSLA